MRTRVAALVRQVIAFGVVGGIGFLLDVGIFTLLRETVFAPDQVHGGALIAKTISTSVAIVANWLGNRYWTFGGERRSNSAAEAFEFVVASVLGMVVGLACLGVSHYVLGLRTVLDDNVSSNVVGLLLGSIVRFALYRWWVFSPKRRIGVETVSTLTAPVATL